MSTEETTPQTSQCAPCDLEGIDTLACTAAKFQRQAEVINAVAVDLVTYRGQYTGAKKAYSTAWDAAHTEIATIRAELDNLDEQLHCRLPDDKRECLEKARDTVFAEIDRCSPQLGCCAGPCQFDDTVSGTDDAASLSARIQTYRDETTANTACYVSLIGEPGALAARVAAVKGEVAALSADIAAGGDASAVVTWYARWLIADRQLEPKRIGDGFTTVAEYMDCLCTALTCISSAWPVIAVLEGAKAQLMCQDEAKAKACQQRKDDTLDSILDAYQECCGSTESTTTGPSTPATPTTGGAAPSGTASTPAVPTGETGCADTPSTPRPA